MSGSTGSNSNEIHDLLVSGTETVEYVDNIVDHTLLTFIHFYAENKETLLVVSSTASQDIFDQDKNGTKYKLVISRIKHSRFTHFILCGLFILLVCIIFRNRTNGKFL